MGPTLSPRLMTPKVGSAVSLPSELKTGVSFGASKAHSLTTTLPLGSSHNVERPHHPSGHHVRDLRFAFPALLISNQSLSLKYLLTNPLLFILTPFFLIWSSATASRLFPLPLVLPGHHQFPCTPTVVRGLSMHGVLEPAAAPGNLLEMQIPKNPSTVLHLLLSLRPQVPLAFTEIVASHTFS